MEYLKSVQDHESPGGREQYWPNLGFDELYKPVFDLTESLRAKQFNDELFALVQKQYNVILNSYNSTK